MKKIQKLFLALCFIASHAFSNDPFTSGNESANILLNHFKGNIESTITNPIANGGTLSSVDGKISGNATLTCNDKNVEFLTLSYTGDDFINIVISMDRDGDGIKDSNYSFEGINNICSNGFAKCSSNFSSKNDNCRFYTWENIGHSLNAKEIKQEEALGCYCISTACGNLAQSARERILKDIGGGLIYVLSTGSSDFVVGGSAIKNNSLIYYGSNANSCGNLGEIPNINKNSNLITASKKLASEQIHNENSVYSIFEKSTDNSSVLDKETENILSVSSNNIDSTLAYNKNSAGYSFSYTDSKGDTQSSGYQHKETDEILYCEIEYSEISPTLFSDNTTRGKTTNSNSVIKTEIKECINNVCPLENGQKQKFACGGIDNFADTIGVLSGLEEVTKDFQCSK